MNAIQKALEKLDNLEVKEHYNNQLIPTGWINVEHVKDIINNLEIDIINEIKTI